MVSAFRNCSKFENRTHFGKMGHPTAGQRVSVLFFTTDSTYLSIPIFIKVSILLRNNSRIRRNTIVTTDQAGMIKFIYVQGS